MILFLDLVFSAACKEAYDPPVVSSNLAYLVVEGFINNGADSTLFTLSHTYKIGDTAQVAPELHAKVTVQGNDNSAYPLTETGNGNYGNVLSLNGAVQYRLDIVTTAGKEYRSDYVPLKPSPPIDSIYWQLAPNGLQIYVDSHDPQNASNYYRWSYAETWQFHSVYYSEYQYDAKNNKIVPRIGDSIYTCWKSDQSTNIMLANTTKLSRDEVYEEPMVTIPLNSWEISLKYSINVKQYVLTADAFAFWQVLQKNTEQIGTIFSPQPFEIAGNIHSLSDSTERVIGYVSGGTYRQLRTYITPDQIPGWNLTSYTDNCVEKMVIDNPDTLLYYLAAARRYIPRHKLLAPFPYYEIESDYCVDCTLVGSNTKPSFWP